ncbi:MAG: rod shape-determining protein MreC [Bacteroidia bacterium]|nr:rod shape-determining protein MreC [Bacteroidia bacterium]
MRNLFKFIIRYHVTLLFIVIEFFSLFLTIQTNSFQRASFINSSTEISGHVYSWFSSVTEYLSVKDENDKLALENIALRKLLKANYINNFITLKTVNDSLYKQKYDYFPAKIINNSVMHQNNYLTLNKGYNQGVRKDMAIINPQGIVGIVKDVSPNFAIVIPAININAHISAKIKKWGCFGTISWDGLDYRKAQLNEIPFHIKLSKGDTLVTSGYSSMFPEGIMVGTISDFDLNDGKDFYNINVNLSTDFMSLNHVYVISNLYKDEQKELENTLGND